MLITTAGSLAQAADDLEEIKKLCMAGVTAAMSQSGLTLPEGMGDFTCSCFSEEMKGKALLSSCKPKKPAKNGLTKSTGLSLNHSDIHHSRGALTTTVSLMSRCRPSSNRAPLWPELIHSANL